MREPGTAPTPRDTPVRRRVRPRWFVLVNLAVGAFSALACATTATAKPPSTPLVQRPKDGPVHSLVFRHSARPTFTGLEPGSYVVEIAGESYAASSRFRLPSDQELRAGKGDWAASFAGDQLDMLANGESAVGLLVPARLATVKVRVSQNGTVIFDGLVTPTTSCTNAEPVAGPDRLCIFMDEDFNEPSQ